MNLRNFLPNEPMDKPEPIHFTQYFNISLPEQELEFFDINLIFDSGLFIDPFLLRRSPLEEEKLLFERFGNFFRFAFDKSIYIKGGSSELAKLRNLLSFHEIKEIGLGYTEKSNNGSGPGSEFANNLFRFFVASSAKRFVKDDYLYPDGKFNPKTLEIFIDKLGPDGISDITANLIMDYLIDYTQRWCKILKLPTKKLPLNYDGFDFTPGEEEWKNGNYYELPENPFHPGQAIIFVPKRLLRACQNSSEQIVSKIKSILSTDTTLTLRFADFLLKNADEISNGEIRDLILAEDSILKKYFELMEKEDIEPYDFNLDNLAYMATKKYAHAFDKRQYKSVVNKKDLMDHIDTLLSIFEQEISDKDTWRDLWIFDGNTPIRSNKEAVAGRILRAMGMAYFKHTPEVHFIPECGTGNGPIDFCLVYKKIKIAIEIKKLDNSSPKGTPPLPSYLHGIERQLPDYIKNLQAEEGYYITLQHWSMENRPVGHHGHRVIEIENRLPKVITEIKKILPDFGSINYRNIKVIPKSSSSAL